MSGSLPLAIVELLKRFFGLGARPLYGQTLAVFAGRPYQALFEQLASVGTIEDLSDPNYDLGPRWWVTSSMGASIDVRISYVGPYFVILNEAGQPARSGPVEELLVAAGFVQLDRKVLEMPVRIWEPEVAGSAYEFIFAFDQGLPWE